MKGIDAIIASILILIISISAVFLALQLGAPSTQRAKEILLMQEGKNNLITIDNAIKSVLAEGEGSSRVLRLSLSGGNYKIDNNTNSILFSMESRSKVIAEGISKIENGINFTGFLDMVYLNLSYNDIQILNSEEFGRGYRVITIRNNGYNDIAQKQMIYVTLTPVPPTILTFTKGYNQTQTYLIKGTTTSSPNNLNDLGVNTYDIIEGLEAAGQHNYFQDNTENITGFNTTSADYTNSLDNQNYNVTSTAGQPVGTSTKTFNQSDIPYIYYGENPSGDYNNLNVLGEGLTYDISEKGSTTSSTILMFFDNFEINNYATIWTEAPGANSWERGNQRSYNGGSFAGEWEGVGTDQRIELINSVDVSDAITAIAQAYIFIEGGFDATDYVCMDYSCNGGSTWNANSGGGSTLCMNGNTDPENVWNLVSINIGSVCNPMPSNFKIRFRARSDGSAEDADIDYVNITKIIQTTNYSVEVWHNSSSVSYSGVLNSINVTLNFTSNVSDAYSLQIYDFANSQWVSGCDSGNVMANMPTKWWCNKTINPLNYVSQENIIRMRINSTSDFDNGILKEDYVQYYIGYTTDPTFANISVEHNSSTILENPLLITRINITTLLKTNVSSGITFRLYIYNFNAPTWEQCSQISINTNYVKMECVITSSPSNYISDNKIRVRLNSSGDTISHQIMEDYLIYQLTLPSVYRMEVEHNATGVSYSGNLDNISVSLNFSTNVTSTFNFLIYNFSSSDWEICDSVNPVVNNWYMLWCNETTPNHYLNSGIIRARLNEFSHNNLAEVKEDYIQYYVTYTQ